MNGSTTPSLQAEDLAVEDAVPGAAAGRASTTSGNWPLTSCRSREYSRTSAPRLWSWARMPSYLSSTQTSGPRRRDDLGGVLGRRGEHELERVEQRQLGVAEPVVAGERRPVRPMSPVSIPAHLTSSSGRSNAFAMAASTSPSRRPMRSSPPRTLTMALAVGGSDRASRSRSRPAFAAGPDAASIASNVAATSGRVGLDLGRRRVADARRGRPPRRGRGRSGGRRPRRGRVARRPGDRARRPPAIADQPMPVAR